jgi:hypothetical protein
MATLTATRAAATFPVAGMGGAGNLKVAWGVYEIATNPTAADIIQMCRVPKGATVLGGWLYGDDIDTGTEAFDMDIGWQANGDEVVDPDGFGNFGVMDGDTISQLKPVAGLIYPFQGVLLADGPKTFNAETVIALTVNVAANATGTGTVTVVVFYAVP